VPLAFRPAGNSEFCVVQMPCGVNVAANPGAWPGYKMPPTGGKAVAFRVL
jgi:hypothetical protein